MKPTPFSEITVILPETVIYSPLRINNEYTWEDKGATKIAQKNMTLKCKIREAEIKQQIIASYQAEEYSKYDTRLLSARETPHSRIRHV